MNRLRILSNEIAITRGILELTPPADETSVFFTGNEKSNYYCGYCERKLINQVDNLNIVNAALKCPVCESYNEANKTWPFLKPPILLKDVNKLPLPMSYFSMSPVWAQLPHSLNLMSLSDTLINDFMLTQTPLPLVLQHYTSFPGMTGIIKSKALWATDITYMNDSSELKLAIDVISKYLDEKAQLSSDNCRELIRRVSLKNELESSHIGYYAICFCSNNDILSQWRAYGDGGNGYAIGLSTAKIPVSNSLKIRKVIYDPQVQLSLVKGTVDAICSIFEECSSGKSINQLDNELILPGFASFLYDHLKEYLFTFKHFAFHEENEVRILYHFDRDKDLDHLEFRSLHSIPVPYLNLKLGSDAAELPILPIVTITHGPTLQPELTVKSLSLFLEKNNLSHVEIFGSKTPLRI